MSRQFFEGKIRKGEVIEVVPMKYPQGGYKVVKDENGVQTIFMDGSIHGLGARFTVGTEVEIQFQAGPSYGLDFAWIKGERGFDG